MSRHRSLDGLRALALALVLAYHLDVPGLGGGFVGVDLFFVLSGYLITSLLVDEHRRTGEVSLRTFWARRVRRLWPLAWVTFMVVAAVGLVGVWGPDQRATLPAQTFAAVVQLENWWQIGNGGYVAQFTAPSPLRHVWSLSVEEQFYLVWPLALVAALAVAARRPALRRAPWAVLGVLVAGSVATGFVVGPTWAYLGTPTRAVAPLLGAGLALAWARHPLAGPQSVGLRSNRRARRLLGGAAVVGAAVLGAVAVVAAPEDSWLGHGGFTLVAAAGTALVAAAVAGPLALRDGLAAAPLVWVGDRSYAVYLLHWPVIVALGPDRPLWARVVVTLAVSFAGAEVLRRLVEVPVTHQLVRPRPLALASLGVAVFTVAALLVGSPTGPTPTDAVAASLTEVPDPVAPTPGGGAAAPGPGRDGRAPAGGTAAPPTAPPTTCAPRPAPPTTFGGSAYFDLATIDEVADPGARCGTATRVLVIGDSIARGISNGLVSLGDPRLQVWDRSVLGCSFNAAIEGKPCPSWRTAWSLDVLGIDPDVVLLYTTVPEEQQEVDDAPYLSDAAHFQRVAKVVEAVEVLSASGAEVVLTSTAVPRRPNGLFYCRKKAVATRCDPDWVRAWNRSLLQAASVTGTPVLDAAGWLDSRPASAATDRPDGVHLSGAALVEHARWLVPRLLAVDAGG